MAAPETAHKAPTYGNWRRPQAAGLGRLGLATTVLLLGGLVLVALAMMASLWLALGLAVVLGLIIVPMSLRDRYGRTAMARMGTALAWRAAEKNGSTIYVSGPLGRTGHGSCTLPGLAAASQLTEAHDAWGRPFALLTYPATNHHVVVINCDADGAGLVDPEQIDTWVAHWGDWLSGLAHEPGLVGASVTVETAPDTGVRLSQEVRGHTAEDAPQLAKDMLNEVLETYPAGSAHITTRIALTYAGAARPGYERREAADMAVELGNRLPHLTSGLAMTGAGTAVPMTAVQLAEAVRIAYDPSVATLIEEAQSTGGSGLTWSEAGPYATREARGHYEHDGGAHSITWTMYEAPRGAVQSSVLTKLLQPSPDIARKRVTLLYRPHSPAEATRVVQRDRRDATFKARQTKSAAARDSVEVRAATQAEEEEARGAGVVRFSLVATATVLDAAHLPRAEAAMENLAGPARIALRRAEAMQAAAFAAALPIGLVLPLHVMVPSGLSETV